MTAFIRDLFSRRAWAVLHAKSTPPPTWTCDQCGATNPETVLTCWKCGA